MATRRTLQKKRSVSFRIKRAKVILKKSIRTKKNVKVNNNVKLMEEPSFNLLAADVIMEVVSRVASSSVTDFMSCKLSCKALNQIGKEKCVIEHVGIEDFDIWRLGFNRLHSDDALAFFRLCADCNNPGALFHQGMYEYFSGSNVDGGVKNLEKAAKLGHTTAAYVLGLIMICCGSENEQLKGIRLVNEVKACTGKRIVECRIRLTSFIRKVWMKNSLVRQCKSISFPKEPQKHDQCRRCPWSANSYLCEDEDDALFCEACTCEFESEFFCQLFS